MADVVSSRRQHQTTTEGGPVQRHDAKILRGALLATALAVPVAVLLGWLGAGTKGAIGAGLGMALAAAFFSVTVVVVDAAARVSNSLILPAALGTYLLKLILLMVGLFLLADTTAFNRTAFGLAVVAGTCVYLIAELRMASRARIPAVVIGDDGTS
jgi:ATP synthase protein I